MNTKLIATALTALAVVGTLSLAYAQTTTDTSPSTAQGSTGMSNSNTPGSMNNKDSTGSMNNGTMGNSSTNSNGTVGNAGSTSMDNTTGSTLPARADRN